MHKLSLPFILFTSITVLTAHSAQAKPINMRPGLWEVTTSSDLLRLVPHISPDQMQNMKDLAKEYGLEMPNIENGAAISRTCITQEMVEQHQLPKLYQEELGCASNEAIRDENAYQINFTCDGKTIKGKGTVQGVITSPQTFTGNSSFTGQAQGAPVNEKAEIQGKWIGASCGNVKPL
jgi:hypothetical protein